MTNETQYVFPMSFAQQRLWFLDRMAPGNPFYNIPLAIPIGTYLNLLILERALNAIVHRHESLRTVFQLVDDEPAQIVQENMSVGVQSVDLTHLAPEQREARTLELATDEALKPFNLESGPLLRCVVLQRGLTDNILLLSMHHIVSDGWSMGIFARELTTLYQSFALGAPDPLPELPIQYADFAVWQREEFQGEAFAAHLRYWRQKLSALPILRLPADKPRPESVSFRGAAHPVALTAPVSAAARALGNAISATPFMTLLTAFVAVLVRRTGQEDIVVGAPIAGRTQPEIEELIGFFVNSLVLRVDASGDPTFLELLERVRDTALEAYAHQDLPFERLVEELNPTRDPSRNPLFQVTFQLVNAPTLQQAATAPTGGVEVHRGTAIFDLAFTLMDRADAFSGSMEYSTDLFAADTVARLDAEFQHLLQAAVTAPQTRLSCLPLLAQHEQQLLIGAARGPVDPAPLSASYVLDKIAAYARSSPAAVAIVADDEEVTYAQLLIRWRQLAGRLCELGAAAEICVGLLLDRTVDLIVAQLAVMEAGAVYVPLDTSYPADRLRFMAGDAKARIVLTQSAQVARSQEIAPAGAAVIVLDEAAEKKRIGDHPAVPGPGALTPESIAYVIYTSGSTGRPKGVATPHRALANHMRWMNARFEFAERDRILQRTPGSFDASVWEIFAPLMTGGRLVLLPTPAQRDQEAIVHHIAKFGVTTLQVVPSLLRLLLEEPAFYTCATLTRVFCGGEPLGDDLREQVATSLGIHVTNLYGPTETTIQSTYYQSDGTSHPLGVPIGRPIDNVSAYVLDRHLLPVPIGVTGDVYIAGEALARGYLHRSALTAVRFIPDPFAAVPGARMYRTGDRASLLASGDLLYASRSDNQIKLRGYRIELGEIEDRIRRVPGVKDCAVTASGPDGAATSLYAFVVPAPETQSSHADDTLFDSHVDHWENVYEGVYGDLCDGDDPDFNTVGWVSSYSGDAIEQNDMALWRDSTVSRIRALEPSRVLEIGCGTGLLLSQLAADCEHYVATDFSGPVVRQLRQQVQQGTCPRNVQIHQRRADRFDGFEDESFDTVILNSVVQYFPSADYLADVVLNAAELVNPGGAIFIGDIRSLPLLNAFYLSVALERADEDLLGRELLKRVQHELSLEKELVLDPSFFHALAAASDRIRGVEVACKRGGYDNELSRYRYDVTLRIGSAADTSVDAELDWLESRMTQKALRSRLSEETAERLLVANVPNARVAAESRLRHLLSNGSSGLCVRDLRAKANDAVAGALDPEAFHELAADFEFEARVRFAAGREDRFDVVLWRAGHDSPVDPAPLDLATTEIGRRRYANDPLSSARLRELTPRIRDNLTQMLPDFMVPSTLNLLDALPLTPNGKLDRHSLIPAGSVQRSSGRAYIAPRDPVEEALAIVWSEVLEMGQVGVEDDFFAELGGHSLIAVQLINRVRESLRTDVPLRAIFEAPTVAGFAEVLLASGGDELARTADLFVQVSALSDAQLESALAGDPSALNADLTE